MEAVTQRREHDSQAAIAYTETKQKECNHEP